MARYAAFLRGVMPTNCKMSALKHAFESAGFKDVRTLLSSGNVVFEARSLFMTLIEKALGKEQTTRTWQTVEKAARSAIPT